MKQSLESSFSHFVLSSVKWLWIYQMVEAKTTGAKSNFGIMVVAMAE